LKSIPTRDTPRGGLEGIPGTVPDLVRPPPGCRYAPRCVRASGACASAAPGLVPVAAAQAAAAAHEVACFHPHTSG
jgi:oligopeptide/dipeptide ABC transporter ATP-binding protein